MSQKSYNQRDNCFFCERKFTLNHLAYGEGNAVVKSYDHIIPRSKGGNDTKINTVVCCKHCNNLKDDLTIPEFIERVCDLIKSDRTFGNIPKTSLGTVVNKAQELKKYVESKGDRLYAKNSNTQLLT